MRVTPTLDSATSLALPFAIICGSLLAGIIVHWLSFAVMGRALRSQTDTLTVNILAALRRPLLIVVPLFAVLLAMPWLDSDTVVETHLEHIITFVMIAGIAWAVIALINTVAAARISGDIGYEEDFRRREVTTRVALLSRALSIIVGLLAGASALMSFPSVRAFGTTLLASAGVAGIAVGFAARPVLENLVAGLQIAFTQPIRLHDEVIVESEHGRIEEITATYVVVRLWDLRRMVLPLTYFLTKPFENWTLHDSNIIGSVLLWVDFSTSLEAFRAEFERVVREHPMWDGQAMKVQVVDSTETAMQVRALVSARKPSELFDLRCAVREALLPFIHQRNENSVPQIRLRPS